jgi:hypothetical protein
MSFTGVSGAKQRRLLNTRFMRRPIRLIAFRFLNRLPILLNRLPIRLIAFRFLNRLPILLNLGFLKIFLIARPGFLKIFLIARPGFLKIFLIVRPAFFATRRGRRRDTRFGAGELTGAIAFGSGAGSEA